MNYFSQDELKCKHCGVYKFDDGFLGLLNAIRSDCGFALPVTSGYRCPEHPIEAKKSGPGAHTTGMAVDIAVAGEYAHELVRVAMWHEIPRVGINQKGPRSERFIHLDIAGGFPSPSLWSY